jgi:trk system potassium uptake protein TrkH
MIGVAAVSTLGQLAVHTSQGHFGPSSDITSFGGLFALAVTAGAGLAAWGHLGSKAWANAVSGVVLAVGLAAFIPALPSDPVVAGAVIGWLLVGFSRVVFPTPPATIGHDTARLRGALTPLDDWLDEYRPAAQHLLLVSVVLIVSAVGFRVGSRLPALGVCLASSVLALAWALPYVRALLSSGSRLPWLLGLPLVLAAFSAARPAVALGWLGVLQAAILATLLGRSRVTGEVLNVFFRRPALLVAASFAGLITVGTLLLSFPAAATGGVAISPIDALFTATSAACVTGLVVVDTPSTFTPFGLATILALIQAGGLNIMVLSAFAALLSGDSLGLKGEQALGEILEVPRARTATRLAVFIVVATLVIEALGTVLLAYPFAARGEGLGNALWKALFHSVSAFCNAGFALQSDSLSGFRADSYVLLVVAALIVLGGLGFTVLGAGWARLTGSRAPLSVQLKVVLTASTILTLGGAFSFGVLEWQRSLAGLAAGEKIVNAIFQSVTARTAGFNTVEFLHLHPATLAILMVLMFIGASPGGTGGGIKTTTAAVLLGAIPAIARGQSGVVLFRRAIPLETVYRAAAIAVLAALTATVGTVGLLAMGVTPFEGALFEVISALGTVGLSLGATAQLTTAGKAIVAALMFIGRIGPLSLALLLARPGRRRVRSPDARLTVG